MTAKDGYRFEELSVGMAHETHHTITEEDIVLFAKVSGDYNPIHMDEEYAKETAFGQRIAHGALTASYISGILGNNLPGPGAIFTHLEMRFRRPVLIGDTVTARAEIIELIERGNRATLKIVCSVDGKPVVSGEAKVMVPPRED
ncbi:MaoC family dehydratase [Henriciella litoralis]|uniref:MaoC family dehydratase n=1 Tax=Henriciella litoralis TaxID=568102 RepID=UPI000A008B85|nr:MaoC family dehydratase [Henriciella litoralis]